MLSAILAAIGLCIGNFLWQGLGDQNWSVAFERSYFQVIACMVVALIDYMARYRLGVA